MTPPSPAAADVRGTLEKILASPGFADAGRLGPFLRHLVERVLEGQTDRLKESVLGVEVFQRRADFDPRTDPIVRVEARRLRQRLEEYYATAGRMDAIKIDLPKGGYVPVFVTPGPVSPIPEPGLRPRPWWQYAWGVVGLAVIGISLGYWQSKYMTRLQQAPIALVGVLPFENVGNDPANEPFSDGLTEELNDRLARTPGVKVVARSIMFQYKGRSVDMRKVAEEVRASIILEGSVRRAGDRVRVTARLGNPTDGTALWSQTYEREWKDIFAIQDDIAQSIANALRIRIKAPVRGPSSRYTDNLEAYNAWLNGRYQANLYSRDGFLHAEDYFKEALAHDPRYAPAHASLAGIYVMFGFYDAFPHGTSWADARREAEEAIKIDPALAEAHASLGQVLSIHEWKWREAEAAYRKAIELDDNSAEAHGFLAISVLLPEVRIEEANREFKRALELDPLNTFVNYGAAFSLLCAGRFDDAIRQYRKTLELKAVHPNMYWDLGMSLAYAKRYDEAKAAFRQSIRFRGGNPDDLGGLEAYFTGDPARARRDIPYMEKYAREGRLRFIDVARALSMLGENRLALDWIEQAIDKHEAEVPFILADIRFKNLQGEPRLKELARRVGLMQAKGE